MYLKGGAMDGLLYRVTMGLTVVGKANTKTFTIYYNFQPANTKILFWYYLQHV